jgi:hypothetical protein
MRDAPLPDLVLYGRPGCHLCDESRELVFAVLDERRRAGLPVPAIVERDITTHPDWERAFLTTIPVLELGDRHLDLALSAGRIRRLLDDVLGGTTGVGDAADGDGSAAPATRDA